MTPIALFDKSFLQSLSIDESIWFDHFFITNICPIFYVETLADLGKPTGQKNDPESEVRIIAEKFPEIHSFPCTHHIDLAHANLIGFDIPMTGQIHLASAHLVSVEGKVSAILENSPIVDAFIRWQAGEYQYVERQYSIVWRNQLSKVNLSVMPELLFYWKEFDQCCKSLQMAHDLAQDFINSDKNPYLRMEICLKLLDVPMFGENKVRARWMNLGYPPLSVFSPYAAYVLSIFIFFYLSLRSKLISPHRASNLTDIAYLFYLPFSMLFVSSDRLHARVTPLFLRPNQEFVWGPNLKLSLKELNIYYSVFPDSEKEKGLWALAQTPPKHITTLVSDLWDRHTPNWREKKLIESSSDVQKKFEEIKEEARRLEMAPHFDPTPDYINSIDLKSAKINRKVRIRKGMWYLLPKESVK